MATEEAVAAATRGMKERAVLLKVIATVRHCSNDCPFMSNDAKYCTAFNKELKWDKNRVVNGNRRLSECLLMEVR